MKNTFRKLAFGLGLAIATITAHADLVTPLVSLQENVINDENGNWLMNQYHVTNNSLIKEHDIYAFAVTNPLAMNAWTNREGWSATTMSKDEWNAGTYSRKTFCTPGCMVIQTGSAPTDTESSNLYLGSFESLFGTEEIYVNFYWSDDGDPIQHGDSGKEFYFSAPPASQYAAFGLSGVVFQSFNNVPEPSLLALFGLAALASLAVTRRRRLN
ncbi:MAG: PEP-CTERM sorting domain-containing protein [Rhodocyclaceae bacterium]|nr:PEP-CTERM sorting domain-containing protein [Rhodocyclaceae bacterium]